MTDTLQQVLVRLKSTNPKERSLALVIIGRERFHAAADQATDALHDPDHEVRAMAAWALDLLGSPITIPALIEALHDSVFDVRSNAGWALVHIAQRIFPALVVPEVVPILRDESNRDARQMAYLVLLHIGGEAAESAIEQYWK
jgi:HEAT repeat protein